MMARLSRFSWLRNGMIWTLGCLAGCLFFVGCGGSETDSEVVRSIPKGVAGAKGDVPELPNPAGKAVLDELGVGDLQVPRAAIAAKKSLTADAVEAAKKEADEKIFKRPARWIDADELPYEFWEVQFAGNRPIGYFHQKVGPSSIGSAGIYRIDADAYRRVPSKTNPVQQFLKVMTIEEVDGGLRTVEASVKQGDEETKIEGSVVIGSLRLKIQKQGTTTGKEIVWDDRYGGPFAYTQSLRGQPMKPGEQRTFSWLDPMTGEILKMELSAGKFLKTPLLDGRQYSLLEIVCKTVRGKQFDETTLWVDENGEALKSYNAAYDVRSYRCDRALAEKIRDQGLCDSFSKTSVPLSKPIDDFKSARRLTFRVICNERRSDTFMPSRTNQIVEMKSSVAGEVVVFAMNETSSLPEGVTPELKIAEAFSQPSPMIQSKDAFVLKLAGEFIAVDLPDASKLEKLRRGVYKWITNKTPFSTDMVGAAEVARSQTGDSTEHAVLLAAVVRSLGVPARVAGGMVYNRSETEPAMNFHCWTEVYLRDHWVPVDASVEESRVNATYIKFTDSPIPDENPYPVMLPILRAIPEMEIIVAKTAE